MINAKVQSRNYGIDLLRMVAMILVAMLHVLGQGGILNTCVPRSVNYEIAWLLEIGAYCAVNCYAIISGYVGVESKFRYSNILYLYLQVIFYTVSITVLFGLLRPETATKLDVVKALFPFAFGHYWYFTSYFCMFFFIPFLNKVLHSINEKQAKILVTTIIAIFSILPTVFHRDMFNTSWGYGAIWLSMLYLIGGCIKRFGLFKSLNKVKSILLYLLCILATWGIKLLVDFTLNREKIVVKGHPILVSYTSITILLSAVSLVMLFSQLNIGKIGQAFIKFFSPIAFGVYLIHVEPLVWNYIIKNRFVAFASYAPLKLAAYVILAALSIWFFCSIIDCIRLYLFKLFRIRNLCRLIDKNSIDL